MIMDNPEVINSQVIFVYDRSIDIRKRQFEFEDTLGDLFNVPFNSFAVSDQQDGNIPRFEATSKHGFSKLQVSQFRTNLITNFKDDYRTDFELVKEYLNDRIPNLKYLLEKEKNSFSAFIIELGFEFNDENTINEFLKEHSGAKCINEETNDFALSYSYEFKNDFFINIKCSKYTEGVYKIVNGEIIKENNETKKGISVILDINSKLAKNKGKNYGVEIIDSLEKEIFNILSTYNLKDYLNGQIK